MTEFVSLIMAIAAFGYITYPLLKRRRLQPAPAGNEHLQELYSKRNTTYSMLKELEFDRHSGILTDEDYKELEAKYKSKAVDILKALDGGSSQADDTSLEIEEQVLAMRRSRAKTADQAVDIEEQVLALRQGQGPFCHQCGVRCHEGDRFCSRCGAKLH